MWFTDMSLNEQKPEQKLTTPQTQQQTQAQTQTLNVQSTQLLAPQLSPQPTPVPTPQPEAARVPDEKAMRFVRKLLATVEFIHDTLSDLTCENKEKCPLYHACVRLAKLFEQLERGG